MNKQPQKKNISMQQVLTALLDTQNVFPPAYFRHLSDLEGKDLEAFRSVWPKVNTTRRYTLLEDLEALAELDTLVSFDSIARLALEDPDPRVRTVAIRLLWESEDYRLVPDFLRLLNEDESKEVRAAAASALGLFVYLGELEEIPEDVQHLVEEKLLDVMRGQDDELVRRRALESLGYSGRDEVPELIREAYLSSDPEWVSSALFAMGRSADQSWEPDVLRMLKSPKANIQLEAVRAAGELAIDKSRRALLDMLEEEAQDSEIRAAVIWSLSQIGGEEVRETLEKLADETDDSEELEILESALDNLSFTEDADLTGMFDFADLGQLDNVYEGIDDYLSRIETDDSFDIDDLSDDSSDSGTDRKKKSGNNKDKS